MTRAAEVGQVPQWTLADRLRKARETADMTQKELADAVGISQRSVSAYESEGTSKRPVLVSWALVTGVPVRWLTDGTIPPSGPLAQSEELRTFNPKITPMSQIRRTTHSSDSPTFSAA